jgi:hypothetical protein
MVTDKTAEAVGVASGVVSTQLKQGVNERGESLFEGRQLTCAAT